MEKKKRVFVKAEKEETPGEKPVTVSADVVRIRLVEPTACGYVSRQAKAYFTNAQAENLRRLRCTLAEMENKQEEGSDTNTNAYALRWLIAKVRPGVTIKFE
jgi:hypothetical protein